MPGVPAASEQLEKVRALERDREASLREGERYFVVSTAWWKSWQLHVEKGGPSPESVDNSELVDETGQALKSDGVSEDSEYVLKHETIWELLKKWYDATDEISGVVERDDGTGKLFVDIFPLRFKVYTAGPDTARPLQAATDALLIVPRAARAAQLLPRAQAFLAAECGGGADDAVADLSAEAARVWVCEASAPEFVLVREDVLQDPLKDVFTGTGQWKLLLERRHQHALGWPCGDGSRAVKLRETVVAGGDGDGAEDEEDEEEARWRAEQAQLRQQQRRQRGASFVQGGAPAVGQLVDGKRAADGRWHEGVIVAVLDPAAASGASEAAAVPVKVHFLSFDARDDEVLDAADAAAVAPPHTHVPDWRTQLRTGEEVEVHKRAVNSSILALKGTWLVGKVKRIDRTARAADKKRRSADMSTNVPGPPLAVPVSVAHGGGAPAVSAAALADAGERNPAYDGDAEMGDADVDLEADADADGDGDVRMGAAAARPPGSASASTPAVSALALSPSSPASPSASASTTPRSPSSESGGAADDSSAGATSAAASSKSKRVRPNLRRVFSNVASKARGGGSKDGSGSSSNGSSGSKVASPPPASPTARGAVLLEVRTGTFYSQRKEIWVDLDSEDVAQRYTHTARPHTNYGPQGSAGRPMESGVVGLRNLGNTCFMNSMLQCLSFTQPLTDFFLRGDYEADLNRKNPLGTGAKLAEAYAALLNDLWSDRFSVVAPNEFKQQLGQAFAQFQGYQQQDSHELLSLLADGLHEDLNRVRKKPYTEPVEPEGRPDAEVAAEAWRVFKLRNDSVVVDEMMGLLRSHLTCPVCRFETVKFDPYSSWSVPIPVRKTRSVRVLMFSMSRDAAAHAGAAAAAGASRGSKRSSAGRGKGGNRDKGGSKSGGAEQMHIVQGGDDQVGGAPLLRPRVVRFVAEVPKDGTHTDVAHWLSEHAGVALTDLLLTETYSNKCSSSPLFDPRDLDAARAGARRHTYSYTHQLKHWQADKDVIAYELDPLPTAANTSRGDAGAEAAAAETAGAGGGSSSSVGYRPARNGIYSPVSAAPPDPWHIVELRFMPPGRAYQAVRLSDVVRLPRGVTRRQLHRVVWERAQFMFDADFAPSDAFLRALDGDPAPTDAAGADAAERRQRAGWRQDAGGSADRSADRGAAAREADGDEDGSGDERDKKRAPYVVHRSTSYDSPLACDDEAWTPVDSLEVKMTAAGMDALRFAPPEDAPRSRYAYTARADEAAATDEEEAARADAVYCIGPIARDATAEAAAAARGEVERGADLMQCLDKFREREQLGANDEWFCPKCKELVPAFKQMDLWSAPEVLVLHLKRFYYERSRYATSWIDREKIGELVRFPLEGLDLRDYVRGGLSARDPLPVYDLYAVSNHIGGMGGGHYTAYVRQPESGKWYLMDDSRTSEVDDPSEVVSDQAYVLFYRRRSANA